MSDISTITRRESGEDRRRAIALAARTLIAEKGLEGLRTRDIAQRVGINIATLHYHVPTKEALVALVAESLRDDFQAQSQRHPRTGKSGLEQLRLEFADFRETVTDTPEMIVVLPNLFERARRDPAIGAIVLPLYDYWRQQFTDIFTLGIADGSFRRTVDPAAAACIVTGALSDHWRGWTEFRASLDGLIAELERAFTPHLPD